MCGIAGGFGRPNAPTVERMLTRLHHRGPDDQGTWASAGIVLGHTRLSIIDLETGHQPIASEDGRVVAVVNGEIYNYRELRARLQAGGHRFCTQSDSEVLVHLYEDRGPAMVEEFDGMFALVLHDRASGRLLLARDPLGIKPLYGGVAGETFYFASEIGALLEATDRVWEFPEGTRLVLEPSAPLDGLKDAPGPDDTYALEPYWQIPEGPPDVSDPRTALEGVRERLRRAVGKRLLADVPVGVFLSGGLDSSLIAAWARRLTSGTLHSFAVGQRGSDDLRYAAQVAAALGTEHHEYTYGAEDLEEALPTVIRHLESYDPALVRSAVPTYFVSRLARRHVKVVLSGEGADELFAGYEYLRRMDRQRLHRELRTVTAALHNTNLQRVDRMSMAHALEARVPFLDLEMIRWAFRLDPSVKLRGAEQVEKWVLRQAAEGLLPPEVVHRGKAKFAHGTGTSGLLRKIARRRVALEDLRQAQRRAERAGSPVSARAPARSREELLYYRIFREHFPQEAVLHTVGRTRSVIPGELGDEREAAQGATA
ncbi:asparagine synthase B [Limnochorda pilosa]|uniref:asparagine synthase (glutamine-hydrolyzing) n=1 Tax=Limnochorda pilosa TaxID=1555112 RepID=A0A0K2SP08_LIMPI|nr:asparagine synthase B [Limnochorda pilosa]BAS28873.1 asparagine synthase [Limnochorda pilosa]